MKSNWRNHIFLLGLLVMLTPGCEKEGPPGMGGPWVKGTLEGTIQVYDESGGKLDEMGGFTVTVQSAGLNSSTDDEGYFRIDSLPTGTYDIICEKEGFVNGRVVSYQFIGGGTQTLSYLTMVPPSTTDVVDLQVGMADQERIRVDGSIYPLPAEGELRAIMLFFGDDDQVRYDRYLYSTLVIIDPRMFEYGQSFTTEIPYYYISEDFFYDKIQTYYVRAYGVSRRDIGFTDRESGLRFYSSLNIKGSSIMAVLVAS